MKPWNTFPIMISTRSSTRINQPIEMVANYIFDLNNSKKWYKNIIYADFLVPKPLCQGTKLFIQKKIFGTEFLSTYKVLECEKGRKLKLKGGYFFKNETTFFLEGLGDSETRIIIRNKSKLNGLLIPIRPLTKLILKISSQKDLSNLKAILEDSKN